MRVSDIVGVIEGFAPPALQEPWDNSGLQTGSPDQEVTGVMVGFDCTEDLVDEAVASGCNMVVTHHPLLFGDIRRLDPRDPVGAAVYAAVRGGVAVYSAHTSADKTPGGVSWAMAGRMGLRGVRVLDGGEDGAGLGVVGELPVPLDALQAVSLVKEAFGTSAVRTSRPVSVPVSTVALCGGSGSSLIGKAREAGAQMYVCGDISYHHFFTPEDFMVVDAGHFETEAEIVDVLCTLLRKNFPNFAIRSRADARDANPVKYF